MRSHWLLVVAILFSISALAAGYVAWAPRRTGLVAREATHDFGQLRQGAVVDCEFRLTNYCDEPIAITDVIKSCACTTVECGEKSLRPGQKTSIKVGFQTGRGRGQTKVPLVVRYKLEDGRDFQTDLWLTADVLPDIVFDPPVLEFDPQHTKRVVKFSPRQEKEFTLQRVSVMHPAFQARLLPSGTEVEVEIKPEAASEELPTTFLIVENTSPHEPVCQVPLVVRTSPAPAE